MIRGIISKIKRRIQQNICYSRMEGKNIATFSMCSGKYYIESGYKFAYLRCLFCPYFIDKRGENDDK